MMTPEDPRHGSYAGAQAHRADGTKLCAPCEKARRRYHKGLTTDHVRGNYRVVDATKVRKHIFWLHEDCRMSWYRIADKAGVSLSMITGLRDGRKRVLRSRAARILAVTPDHHHEPPHENGYMPRHGAVRRLQALQAIGWGVTDLSTRLGISRQNISAYSNGTDHGGARGNRPNRWVTVKTWTKISKLYEELSMTPGPSTLARDRARKHGWAPPLGWDDIDDPNEVPTPMRPVSRARRLDHAAIQRRLAGDLSLPVGKKEKEVIVQYARDHGWTYKRIREVAGIKKPERYIRKTA